MYCFPKILFVGEVLIFFWNVVPYSYTKICYEFTFVICSTVATGRENFPEVACLEFISCFLLVSWKKSLKNVSQFPLEISYVNLAHSSL